MKFAICKSEVKIFLELMFKNLMVLKIKIEWASPFQEFNSMG